MTHPRPTGAAPLPTGVRPPHVAAWDGLRGVAVLGVLLFHAGVLPGGFLGVDLFFALSGYLITDLLLREVEATGTVSLAAFWGRRTRRLLPALAIVLVAVTVLVRVIGPPDVVRTTLADGPWVQLDLVNWHLLAESASYWDRFGSARVFEHLWSIAVEEQFYLVWPVVLLVIARGGPRVQRRVAVTALVASVVSLVLMIARPRCRPRRRGRVGGAGRRARRRRGVGEHLPADQGRRRGPQHRRHPHLPAGGRALHRLAARGAGEAVPRLHPRGPAVLDRCRLVGRRPVPGLLTGGRPRVRTRRGAPVARGSSGCRRAGRGRGPARPR
jgi:hypothetical protein